MPVNLEDDLRAALRPYRADPAHFEAAVRERLKSAESKGEADPLAGLSPWLKSAAAFLPLQVIAGCKATPVAAQMAPAAGVYKVASYAALPAISLFVLLGATLFSVARIRSLRPENGSPVGDEQAVRDAIREWWRRHRRGAWSVFAVTIILPLIGATWLLFLLYISSFGLLLYVLTAFARLGLANRESIGRFCLIGLMFLGQVSMFAHIGAQDIHFVDPTLVAAVFYLSVLLLLPFIVGRSAKDWGVGFALCIFLLPLVVWTVNPILWPATPPRIKSYVESFTFAPYAASSWQRWEIVANWTIRANLDPDFSGARQLLAQEISGDQNPFILGSAFRLGMVRNDQLAQLKNYEQRRRSLVDDLPRGMKTQPILSLNQEDWVIRAAVLQNDLSAHERDNLEQRLHATLEALADGPFEVLETALRVTQLLEVIERPVDPDRYRERIHVWLRNFHSTAGGGFQIAGGFKPYPNSPVGSLEATSHALELMEIYGIPDDLDLNWVRSFLRPAPNRFSGDKWIAAVGRDRLNRLPAATPPTWLEVLYYENSLLAAVVLVGLCLFATLSMPRTSAQPMT